jgi:hypothetical protein
MFMFSHVLRSYAELVPSNMLSAALFGMSGLPRRTAADCVGLWSTSRKRVFEYDMAFMFRAERSDDQRNLSEPLMLLYGRTHAL